MVAFLHVKATISASGYQQRPFPAGGDVNLFIEASQRDQLPANLLKDTAQRDRASGNCASPGNPFYVARKVTP